MNNVIANIYKFKTREFSLSVDALPEDDLDLSWDDDEEVLRDLRHGTLVAFSVRARIVHTQTGIKSEDYLGGCIYRDFVDFKETHGYFTDMVRNVCADMRKQVALAKTIKLRGSV